MFIYAFISSICIFMLLAMFVLLYPYLSVKVKDTYENLISKRAEAGIIGDENNDLNNVNANDDTLNENNNDSGTGDDVNNTGDNNSNNGTNESNNSGNGTGTGENSDSGNDNSDNNSGNDTGNANNDPGNGTGKDITINPVYDIKVNATSVDITFDFSPEKGFTVKYRSKENYDNHGKDKREDKTLSMDEICTHIKHDEGNSVESRENGWHVIEAKGSSLSISGLEPDKEYELHVLCNNTSESKPVETIKTPAYGFGDPFKDIDSFFCVSEREETGKVIKRGKIKEVKMSSPNGCLNAKVKPVMDSDLYDDILLVSKSSSIEKGAEAKIIMDQNGHYCYLTDEGDWLVFIEDVSGNKGWIDARKLMIDSMRLFSPEDSKYAVRISRSNAYSSLFTAGGNAKEVNGSSDSESRFDIIKNDDFNINDDFDGYNLIENITGTALPNYGSRDELPVIWDLAHELIQCQKGALENGYTLILYDGYRPQSASKAVSDNLSSEGYLSKSINNRNLAKGFLQNGSYDHTYYISKYSRHNKGIAVDLSLVRLTADGEDDGEAVMQTKMHTLDFRCNMYYNTWEADLLSDIMMGHGSNLECLKVRSEWWHFQMKNDRTDIYPLFDKYEYNDFVF